MIILGLILFIVVIAWAAGRISAAVETLACAIDRQLQPKNEETALKLVVDNTKEKTSCTE